MKRFFITIVLILIFFGTFGGWQGIAEYIIIKGDYGVFKQHSSGELVVLSHVEEAIENGTHYYIEGYASLDTGDSLMVKLVTPANTVHCHFTWDIDANGILTTELWEDASGGMTGGSNVEPLNSNRNVSDTSLVVITSGVTVATSQGTRISNKKVGGTGFKTTSGGNASREDELILKTSSAHQRLFISGSDANIIGFRASWIEE